MPSSVTRLYYGSVNVALNRTTAMVGVLLIMEKDEDRKWHGLELSEEFECVEETQW